MKRLLSLVIFFFFFFINSAYPSGTNTLLDIGMLEKKDGKAIVLIFSKPAEGKNWKIKFNKNNLNIVLYNFSTALKREDIKLDLPPVQEVNIQKKGNDIVLSLILKDEIKPLLSSNLLAFLTKDPHMLGIMFTNKYLKRFKKQEVISQVDKKTKEESPVKKENPSDIDIPFIKYEDIFAIPSKEEKKVKEAKPEKETKPKEESKKEILNPKPPKEEIKKHIKTKPVLRLAKGDKKRKEEFPITRLIASLSAVLGILLISLFAWKKMLFLKNRSDQNLIKILGVHHFGTRQSIAIIQIGEECFLIGITSENIQLLTKLNIRNFRIGPEKESFKEEGDQKAIINVLKSRFNQLKKI